MSEEAAIIELVVQGLGQFDATNDKIQADLTSMERSGRSAEAGASSAASAARDAAQAARTLQSEISRSVRLLGSAAALAERVATAAGVDPNSGAGQALEVGRDVIGGAASGARIGSFIAPGVGTLIGAGGGALVGLAEGLARVEKKIDKQDEREDKRALQHDEIADALIREAGLATIDNRLAGGGRRTQ